MKKGNDESKTLANSVMDQNTIFSDRGIKSSSKLYVLNNFPGTAILIEAGFISNSNDRTILLNNSNQIGYQIGVGIINFLEGQ